MVVAKASKQRRASLWVRRRRTVAWAGGLIAYSVLMVVVGAVMQKQGFYGSVVRPLIQGNLRLPIHYVKSWRARPQRLQIDVTLRDLRKLEQQAQQAIANGVLLHGNEDLVPGAIRINDETIQVQLRLKGDTIRPLLDGKWSFRIRTRGGATLLGMKQFSLHHARERNYACEWVYHEALRREGVIALRYHFVDLTLNGAALGVYALEEHFEKRLLPSNDRREGPIVRYSEDLMWREIAAQQRRFPRSETSGAGSFLAAAVDGFQTTAQLADDVTAAQYRHAVYLLESFRRGDLTTSQVFDGTLLAKYLALTDLLGAEHGARWHNMRFYYNPVTSKLEPIGFDGNTGQPTRRLVGSAVDRFETRLFDDPAFYREYIRQLERLSQKAYLDGLLSDVEDGLDSALAILWTAYPEYAFSPAVFYRNQEYIQSVLNPVKTVHAYLRGVLGDRIELDVANLQSLPTEVVGLALPDNSRLEPDEPIVLPGRSRMAAMDFRTIAFTLSATHTWFDEWASGLELIARIAGTSQSARLDVFAYPYLPSDFADSDVRRRSPNVAKFEFLRIDETTKTIHVQPGTWTIDEDVIIPAGYTLRGSPGTVLDLTSKALVLSYSPIEFVGSRESPFRVISRDGTGQGLVVLQAGEESVLRDVWFENLGNADRSDWSVTGAVTFYESPVTITHCRFSDSRSEDALNTIRGGFDMSYTVFTHSFSDAFDADFCDGLIADCKFSDCGNDGIDVSGSAVRVERVEIRGVGDKGISCGEDSRMVIKDLTIHGARVGVASKDLSEVVLESAKIIDCSYGLCAFEKKSEFGAGTLRAIGTTIERTSQPYLLERGSTLTIDGRAIVPNTENASEVLNGNQLASGR